MRFASYDEYLESIKTTLGNGCACTMCQWDRMRRGFKTKPRARRPAIFVAWHWKLIARQ